MKMHVAFRCNPNSLVGVRWVLLLNYTLWLMSFVKLESAVCQASCSFLNRKMHVAFRCNTNSLVRVRCVLVLDGILRLMSFVKLESAVC